MKRWLTGIMAIFLGVSTAFVGMPVRGYARTSAVDAGLGTGGFPEGQKQASAEYADGEAVVLYDTDTLSLSGRSAQNNSLPANCTVEKTCTFVGAAEEAGISSAGENREESISVSLLHSDELSTQQLVALLNDTDGVFAAEPNYRYHATDLSLSDGAPLLWGLDNQGQNGGISDIDINAEAAYGLPDLQATEDGQPVIAIVDTGISDENLDLKPYLWRNPYPGQLSGTYGYNFLYSDEGYGTENPVDDNGHGSHCAGIINSVVNPSSVKYGADGLTVNASLMGLKFLDGGGEGDLMDAIQAYHYIDLALTYGINVVAVNNSWGGGGYSRILDAIITRVGEKGCISFFSAGNDGIDCDVSDCSSNFESDYAVVVAAANEQGNLASFSNYGSRYVDLAAPGTDILSTVSANCFNPTAYTREQIETTCSLYNSFNYEDYAAMVEARQNPAQTDSASAKEAGMALADIAAGLPYTDDEKVGLNLTEQPYMSSLSETGQNQSLQISIGQAQKRTAYRWAVPYDAFGTGGVQALSFMFRCAVQKQEPSDMDSEGETEALLQFYDVPASEFSDMELSAYPEEKLDPYMLSTLSLTKTMDCWEHISMDMEPAQKDERRVIVFELYVMGDCANYQVTMDDFGVSKPGVEEQYGKLDFYNGTSMACPYVTGSFALLGTKEIYDGLDALEKVAILKSCTTVRGGLADKVATGGMLDLKKLKNEKYREVPILSSAVVNGGEVVLSGKHLSGNLTLDVNGSPVEFASDSDTQIRFAAAGYVNHYVTITVTNQDSNRSSAISCYLAKGKKSYEFVRSGELYGDIRNIVSDGAGLYLISGGELMYCNPNAWDEAVGNGEMQDGETAMSFYGYGSPDISLFTGTKINTEYNYAINLEENQMAYLDGHIYAVASLVQMNSHGFAYLTERYLVDYDLIGEVWRIVSAFDAKDASSPLSAACREQTLAAYNGKLYLLGGYDLKNQVLINGAEVYDPVSGKWENTDFRLPLAQAGGHAIQYQNRLVYLAGLADASSCSQPEDTKRPATVTLPAAMSFDGAEWSVSKETLSVYDYEPVLYGDTLFYRTNCGLGLSGEGVVLTGMVCDGYGDTVYYEPERDAYQDSGYQFSGQWNTGNYLGASVDETLYVLAGEDSEVKLYKMPITSGQLRVTSGKGKVTVVAEQDTYMPGSTVKMYAWVPEGYYLHSLTVTDHQGHSAKFKKGEASMVASADIELKDFSNRNCVGKYVTKVSLSKSSLNYPYNKKPVLKATVSASASYYANKTVKWSSSNTKYATVDKNGKVTLKKAGIGKTVTITAKAADGSGKKASCKIKICRPVTRITVSGNAKKLSATKTMRLKATVSPANATVKSVQWKSDKTSYATVSADGVVTAKKAGIGKTVTITAVAKDGSGVKGSYKIKIVK